MRSSKIFITNALIVSGILPRRMPSGLKISNSRRSAAVVNSFPPEADQPLAEIKISTLIMLSVSRLFGCFLCVHTQALLCNSRRARFIHDYLHLLINAV
ncbi:hypothetical protein AMJ80_09925 [bacterium SM23_31]|nr:MAG: hypothetical protein AMJ80_09925 [bacterium SM23_31]